MWWRASILGGEVDLKKNVEEIDWYVAPLHLVFWYPNMLVVGHKFARVFVLFW